jgi:DNA-directed RNA polymerase specialized sigma24 family protein
MSRPAVSRRPALVRRMRDSIDTLSDRERHVLALLLVERLTVLEAAGALKMTMREVGEVYATALQRLARGTGVRAQRRAA